LHSAYFFLYSIHASSEFSLFRFLYFIFFSLTASATSSFHHHVSLRLQGPFDIPHMCCAVSIIIFFILCQCSFTSRCFHSSSSTLSLTMLLYYSQVCSSLSFHTRILGSNFICHLFVVLNHMSITSSLCFGMHSLFGMTSTLQSLTLSPCAPLGEGSWVSI